MTATAVLAELNRAGVRVTLTDAGLLVSPKSAINDHIRSLVIDHKSDLILSLDAEVRWRVLVMRRQVTGRRALPVLMARLRTEANPGRCFSCGDPVQPSASGLSRCRSCRIAAGVVAFNAIHARCVA